MTNEQWKPIPGYEGRYEVSDQGRVKSYQRDKQGAILRPGRMPQGHLSVALGHRNSQCVHKLVLLSFVGAPAPAQECRHLNGIPADNRLENLCWGSRSENIKDKTAHGLGKLKPKDIETIKIALQNNYWGLQVKLARQFNVSECTINDIKKGRTHV
jgi:hypothetical protein